MDNKALIAARLAEWNVQLTDQELDQLVAHGRSDLSSYKLPAAVRIVDRLPLNSGDKLDRRALAAEEASQQADG